MTLGSGQQSSLGLCSKVLLQSKSFTYPVTLSAGAPIPEAPWLPPPQLPETIVVQMFFHVLFKALEEPF